ncbi:MAG: hypothetical protein A49_06870 [Methyloceanibacter sp.]|nr:MAG: hypothetical protein A49_06870 [Methyloceanibacter sp.]
MRGLPIEAFASRLAAIGIRLPAVLQQLLADGDLAEMKAAAANPSADADILTALWAGGDLYVRAESPRTRPRARSFFARR